MKVGDLVKYRHWHGKLQNARGLVCEVKKSRYDGGPERVRVIWNHPLICDSEVLDWCADLEIVSESR